MSSSTANSRLIAHGFTVDRIHGIASITIQANVPETSVDLVSSVCFSVIPIQPIRSNTFLSGIIFSCFNFSIRSMNCGYFTPFRIQSPTMFLQYMFAPNDHEIRKGTELL